MKQCILTRKNVSSQAHIPAGDKSAEPNKPPRSGYTFEGWFEDEGLTDVWDFDTEIHRDYTLYAKWKKNPKAEHEKEPEKELVQPEKLKYRVMKSVIVAITVGEYFWKLTTTSLQ